MAVEVIDAATVRSALRAVYYARSLGSSPLLGLDLVSERLLAEGLGDSRHTREWVLGRILSDTVDDALYRLRAAADAPAPPDASDDLGQIKADFRVGCIELEAWSVLRCRYFAAARPQLRDVAYALGVVYRTLARRLRRGHRLLATDLQTREADASHRAAARPGTPARERVLVEPGAQRRDTAEGIEALLAAVRDDAAVARLGLAAADEIARRPAATLEEYWAGRVAEWSRPQHRLDDRFIELSLLVDRGEDVLAGRWGPGERRYDSLHGVLDAVDETAFVILGPPGCGKSTLLRRFELDAAIDALREQSRTVTFLVELNRYGGDRPGPPTPPLKWLCADWSSRFPDLPSLEDLLAEGRVVLLLDALNEMPHSSSADLRARILAWKDFTAEVFSDRRGNRAIYTCRSLDYSAPMSSPALRVPLIRIEPLSDERVREFLTRYAPGASERLWAELAGSRHVELVRAPYLLKLLVAQAASGGTVTSDRAALFTSFVRGSLKREVERDNPLFLPDNLVSERDYRRIANVRSWDSPYELPSRGDLFPSLERLAMAMQRSCSPGEMARLRMDYRQAIAVLGPASGEPGVEADGQPSGGDGGVSHGEAIDKTPADLAEHAVGEAVIRAGVAVSVLDDDLSRDEVMFAHQLLQEYFAARCLAVRPEPRLAQAPWRAEEAAPPIRDALASVSGTDPMPPLPSTGWEETTKMAAAMAPDADAYVLAIAEANLPLAGRCAAGVEMADRVSPATSYELRHMLVTRSRDPGADLRARIDAGRSLGRLGDPRLKLRTGPNGDYLAPQMVTLAGGDYEVGQAAIQGATGGEGSVASVQPAGPAPASLGSPRHAVTIAPFALGRFPVTNAEWERFVASGGYDDQRFWDTDAARKWRRGDDTAAATHAGVRRWYERFKDRPAALESMRDSGELSDEAYARWQVRLRMSSQEFESHLQELYPGGRITEPRLWRDEAFNHPSQPVVGVCWFEARAYCEWLSEQTGMRYRLPTEVEWEAAARDVPAATVADNGSPTANTIETHLRAPTPTGVFPEGDSASGLTDMIGNVNEWTSSAWGADSSEPDFGYPYHLGDGREDPSLSNEVRRVLRGGSWADSRAAATPHVRQPGRPDGWDYSDGFRLASAPGGGGLAGTSPSC